MPSPLVAAIQRVLEEHFEGLNAQQIRRAVVRQGRRCTPLQVRQALQGGSAFVPSADGIWRLATSVAAETIAGSEDAPSVQRDGIVTPYLSALPPLERYVVFDLETTGVRPDQGDRIIQIAAVKMEHGQPTATYNEYVNMGPTQLPYGLKLKLGMVDHPEWAKRLNNAETIETVLPQFRRWVGDWPLVAHNARFDLAFLQRDATAIDWEIDNPIVDSMEWAVLICPTLASHRLEELATRFGIAKDLPAGEQVATWATLLRIDEFNWDAYHNAIVDVLVLAAVVEALRKTWLTRLDGTPRLRHAFQHLMPKAAKSLGLSPSTPPTLPDLGDIMPQPNNQAFDHSPRPSIPKRARVLLENMIANDPHLRKRPAQLEMADRVEDTLDTERFAAIEAPTGTGKTFAYLVPAILWAKRNHAPIAVSTYTRLLQDQLEGDIGCISVWGRITY